MERMTNHHEREKGNPRKGTKTSDETDRIRGGGAKEGRKERNALMRLRTGKGPLMVRGKEAGKV